MFARIVEDLFRRRVPHFLAAYLAAVWAVIEAVDWLVGRYALSAHLVDLALVLLLCMLPTVLMLAYFHGGSGTQSWTRVEKVGIPANLLFSAGVLLLMFSGKDLGAERAGPRATPAHQQVTFVGDAGASALSPNGDVIAYSTTQPGGVDKLLVQDLAGGPPLAVASYQNISSMRWSPDGSELLFSAEHNSKRGAFIVPRLGGTPRLIEPGGRFLAWSPDGSQIASGDYGSRAIWLRDTSTGDADSVALSRSFDWLLGLDWSDTGKLMSVLTKSGSLYTVWTITVDGTQQQKVVEDSLELFSPRWSPAGDAIYYLRSSDQTKELWKVSVSPGTGELTAPPTVVQTGLQTGEYFTVSRSTSGLLYTREFRYSNLWVVTIKSLEPEAKADAEPLTTGTLAKWGPSISPDGDWVAFSMGDATKANIFVMPLKGGPPRQVTFFEAFSSGPAWSPDGTQIAFGSTQGGSPKVWTVNVDGGVPRQFAKTVLSHGFSGTGRFQVLWYPGGKILYQRLGNFNFNFLDPSTEDESPLVQKPIGGMGSPRYSPDAVKVVVRWWRSPPGLWMISLEDSSHVLLHEYSDWFEPVGWSSDGQWVYTMDYTKRAITRISVGGGEAHTVAELPSVEFGLWASMSPDARRFVFEVWESKSDVWIVENYDPGVH